jgi:hypothetical protein
MKKNLITFFVIIFNYNFLCVHKFYVALYQVNYVHKENGTNYGSYFVDDLNAAIGKNI